MEEIVPGVACHDMLHSESDVQDPAESVVGTCVVCLSTATSMMLGQQWISSHGSSSNVGATDAGGAVSTVHLAQGGAGDVFEW
jgi:hypothetical protein